MIAVLHAGQAEGDVLALDEPLSFWGAFDPRSGLIIDASHPQRGANIAGRILMMERTRGSGTAPGGMAEAIRLRTAPVAIVLVEPDVNLAVGAMVADRLYGRSCPIMAVDRAAFAILRTHARLRVTTRPCPAIEAAS
jgi:uncharacterized protein